MDEVLRILRAVVSGGPHIRYNDGEDLEEGRVDGTYDCIYCGPKSFTLGHALNVSCHEETCAWRLAKEYLEGGSEDV